MGEFTPLYSWFFRKNQHNWDSYVLLSIFFSVLKTQNKTKNILYIANLFVPLRLELASAFPRHFSKNKALTIIVVFQKKRRKLSFWITTAPIMVGFICGKHRWTSRQICRVNVHARYRVWAFLYLTVVQTFLRLPRKTLRIVHTLLLCLLVSSLMIVGCRI